MAEKKITRKVISPLKEGRSVDKRADAVNKTEEVVEQAEDTQKAAETSSSREAGKSKRACSFCQGKTSPAYTDIATLRRYLTDRAKIVARAKSNVCSRHQRRVNEQIKYARHLALLPFTPKV